MRLTGFIHFDPADPIYQDHFPGNPVVPGSLILDAFCRVIHQHLNVSVQRMYRFRFLSFVKTGDAQYSITIKDGCAICELSQRDKVCASGRIDLC